MKQKHFLVFFKPRYATPKANKCQSVRHILYPKTFDIIFIWYHEGAISKQFLSNFTQSINVPFQNQENNLTDFVKALHIKNGIGNRSSTFFKKTD